MTINQVSTRTNETMTVTRMGREFPADFFLQRRDTFYFCWWLNSYLAWTLLVRQRQIPCGKHIIEVHSKQWSTDYFFYYSKKESIKHAKVPTVGTQTCEFFLWQANAHERIRKKVLAYLYTRTRMYVCMCLCMHAFMRLCIGKIKQVNTYG